MILQAFQSVFQGIIHNSNRITSCFNSTLTLLLHGKPFFPSSPAFFFSFRSKINRLSTGEASTTTSLKVTQPRLQPTVALHLFFPPPPAPFLSVKIKMNKLILSWNLSPS